ncbi:hypothetical protein [Streptomyces sp. NPDC048637]|uniref:hypothetical protein n=1 Tax=Streptomyces sp. NPDC048637 TaxID=3155636 RepID=UPI0034262A96
MICRRGTPVNVDPANMPICGATPNIARSVGNHSAEVYSFHDRQVRGTVSGRSAVA